MLSPPCSLLDLVCRWPTLLLVRPMAGNLLNVISFEFHAPFSLHSLLFHQTIPWNRKSHGNWSAGRETQERLQEQALKRERQKESWNWYFLWHEHQRRCKELWWTSSFPRVSLSLSLFPSRLPGLHTLMLPHDADDDEGDNTKRAIPFAKSSLSSPFSSKKCRVKC